MASYTLTVNGKARTVNADADTPLLYVLRDNLGLNGPKFGCGLAQCGACTVHVDGQATRSCVLPVARRSRARRSPRSRAWAPRQSRIRCSRRSSTSRRCNAATASTAWSWRRRRCSPTNKSPSEAQITRGARRKPVPLRHASAHRARRAARRELTPEERHAMQTRPQGIPQGKRRARRRLLVRRLAAALRQALRAPKSVAKDAVDSFLVIGGDGRITVFTGKVDLGTGTRTALAQMAADELDVPSSASRW